jgi:hypothetical protein
MAVLERAAPRGHRQHFGAQQSHAKHVEFLAADVLLPHVHVALEPEESGDGSGGHPMLARPGLGDDALLAHTHG